MTEISIKPNQRKSFRTRIFILLGFFLTILIFILLRIAYIQIIQKDQWQKYAQGQMEQRIPILAPRGLIYDRNGKSIVSNRLAYSLYITPAYLPDKKKNPEKRKNLLKYLANKLDDISYKELINMVTIKNRLKQNIFTPILIKRDLDKKIVVELNENLEDLQGVEIKNISMRKYDLHENLSHILGFTGMIDQPTWVKYFKKYKNDDKNPYKYKDSIVGKRGLEKSQDLLLRGKDGLATRLVNSIGQPDSDSIKTIKKAIPGYDIFLTIDRDLQEVAKRLMKNKRGVVIVSKPSTGEILALVSNPSFDPNIFSKRQLKLIAQVNKDKNFPRYNRAIQSVYPPSSIFKLVVAAAAVEGKKISPSRKYTCTGAVTAGGRFFRCHGIHGTLNLSEAINKSCNCYFYQLGNDIGWDVIYEYSKRFFLGESYDIDNSIFISGGFLPNRKWKKSRFKESWYTGDTLNSSIGQGYTIIPPIEVHNIVSTIANEGHLMKPRLINKIVDPITKKEILYEKEYLNKNVLHKKTLKIIQSAMRDVVSIGTAKYARFSEKYQIAGKTGTAQNSNGEPHAWFTCYAPYNSPNPDDRIAVTVLIENVPGGGGLNAAPIATALVKYKLEGTTIEEFEDQTGIKIVELDESDEVIKVPGDSDSTNTIDPTPKPQVGKSGNPDEEQQRPTRTLQDILADVSNGKKVEINPNDIITSDQQQNTGETSSEDSKSNRNYGIILNPSSDTSSEGSSSSQRPQNPTRIEGRDRSESRTERDSSPSRRDETPSRTIETPSKKPERSDSQREDERIRKERIKKEVEENNRERQNRLNREREEQLLKQKQKRERELAKEKEEQRKIEVREKEERRKQEAIEREEQRKQRELERERQRIEKIRQEKLARERKQRQLQIQKEKERVEKMIQAQRKKRQNKKSIFKPNTTQEKEQKRIRELIRNEEKRIRNELHNELQ